ncbi:MAG: hypothetical protein SLAVMIC_00725 [uncultured marine phage]|uniref:Uncharacterized protein n=1 Tax=uncultured marine phage TaxID=707152 RepID=A0A8D9C9D6_9VIRU|nr:MAG: hypothetical protein SLAVMIC_00725 [uncultured marine phage]
MKFNRKRFTLYALRWQLGGIILAPILWTLLEYFKLPYLMSMIILQLIGACIFFPIDMWISRQRGRKQNK